MVKTLAFIHGWASSPEIWQGQIEYFAKDYEVILPDISVAKDIKEAAGIVNVSIKDKKDFVLIGWSLGWLAALDLLKNVLYEAEPRILPQGLIAVNSTPKFCSYEYLGAGSTPIHLNKMIRDCKRNPQKTMEDFYQGLLTDSGKSMAGSFQFKNLDYNRLIYGLYMLKDTDHRDFICAIDIPALIISGAKDTICVPQVSEYMHQRIKHSELKVFDCGHFPFLDKSEEFNSAIDDFIKKL